MRGMLPYHMLKDCKDLKDLKKTLEDMDRHDIECDPWDCPVFGGKEPWCSDPWSWDDESILVFRDGWEIIKRDVTK